MKNATLIAIDKIKANRFQPRIQFDETLLIEHACGCLAAEFRSCNYDSPGGFKFHLYLLLDKSVVIHSQFF